MKYFWVPFRIVFLCASLVMVVIGVMGGLKLVDLDGFVTIVSTHWREVVPRGMVPAVVVGVPTVELLLGGLWFVCPSRRTPLAAIAMALIAGFSAAYIWMWATSSAPVACGCMGALSRKAEFLESGTWLIGRNALMLAVLGWWVYRARSGRSAGNLHSVSTLRRSDPGRGAVPTRGFTMLETLVVLAIVGLLITLLSPMLVHTMDSGREAKSLSNLRQHGAVFGMYHGDFDEFFPYLTEPRATASFLRCEGEGITYRTTYFGSSHAWNIGLGDMYYQGRCTDGPFRSPWRVRRSVWSDYLMPCVYLADPGYWNTRSRQMPPAQLRPTRLSQVVYPAYKSMLVEDLGVADRLPASATRGDGVRRLAVVDGHARNFARSEIRRGMGTSDGLFGEVPPYYHLHEPSADTWRPALHTIDGVRGRDVE